MADHVLRELEAAAQVILATPNLVTQEQRQAAEAVFLNFRKSTSPYQLCREILERSSVDYVLFESAGVIKTALIREWSMMQEADLISLREYLLHYIIGKPTLAPFVRERILQVIAIMVKRGSVNTLGEDRRQMLTEVEKLIMSGDLPRQLLGCSIISAIMQEYVTTVKSSDVGLTWEVHFKAKKHFEATDLKKIFKFCVTALSTLTKEDIQEATLPLIKHLLSISENVLVWGYIHSGIPRAFISAFESVYESDNSPPLRLTVQWQDVILDPSVLDLFFMLYWKIRKNPQLAHHARNCLIQLASLNGRVMNTDAVKLQYHTNYVRNFLKLVSNIEIIDQEALGLANIVRKIVTFCRLTLNQLPDNLYYLFLEQMARLTCLFMEGAAQEESICADDCLYMEAFERMLETWGPFLPDGHLIPEDFLKRSSVDIFNMFLCCHLSPPDGKRGIGGKESNNEEIDANEDDDKNKFKDQLQIIGNFGRRMPSHSLVLLARLIENRTNQLREQLTRLAGQYDTLNISGSVAMDNLYEDLHWLILLAGHVLCMESEGEEALIPTEVMKYSTEQHQQGQTDVNVSLQLLASPQSSISDINGADQAADHVIRLVASVFRICEIEKTAITSNLTALLSPELCSTIVWFLHRWALSYLLPIESYYSEISATLNQAFGEDSAGAMWTVNYLMDKVERNLDTFKGEPAIANETIKLLLVLVKSDNKALYALKSDRLGSIIEMSTKTRDDLLQETKRGIMKAIVQIGTAIRDSTDQQRYWAQTLEPLQQRFKAIACNENFAKNYHQEDVRAQLVSIFDSLIGVFSGKMSVACEPIFSYVHPILVDVPRLLSLYHNYQQLVQLFLEVFYECAKGMLPFLSESDSLKFCEVSVQLIQTYARCNISRVTTDSTAEEDTFQDILLLMQMLTKLLSRDIFDLRKTEERTDEENATSAANVFLYGLSIIMPLMTVDLLKFPALCQQYFKMLTYVSDMHPEKVCTLPSEMLHQLLMSVELGLFSFSHEITVLCCDIVQVLTRYIYSETKKGQPRNDIMAPYMNLLFNMVLTRQINTNLISSTSNPLYFLICCYKEKYQELVQNFIASQADPTVAERLAAAFTELTHNIQYSSARLDYLKFKDNFDKFFVNVQGFLMVK